MAATARQEREMKMKMEKIKDNPNISPVERLRAYVLAKGVTGLKHLNICFKRIDEDKNGMLDFREFKAALKYEGICAPPDVVRQCFEQIDTDHSGMLSFDEFIVALRRSIDPAYKAHGIDVFFDLLLEKTNSSRDQKNSIVNTNRYAGCCQSLYVQPPMSKVRTDLITKAFRKLDRDGSGELTIDDLRGVYNGKKHPKYLNGQWTEDQVLSEWLSSFAGPGKTFDGVVTYEDFENYYAGVSASIDSDVYFDLMMRHAWKL